MSNVFESTALAFELPNQEAQQYALDLHRRCAKARDEFEEDPDSVNAIPVEFRDEEFLWGWEFDVEPHGKNGLFVKVMGGLEFVDALAGFIQHLLKKFDPNGFVQFEWSRECTKPIPTCFSGGAAHITAEKVEWASTLQWLEQHAQPEMGRRVNRTLDGW